MFITRSLFVALIMFGAAQNVYGGFIPVGCFIGTAASGHTAFFILYAQSENEKITDFCALVTEDVKRSLRNTNETWFETIADDRNDFGLACNFKSLVSDAQDKKGNVLAHFTCTNITMPEQEEDATLASAQLLNLFERFQQDYDNCDYWELCLYRGSGGLTTDSTAWRQVTHNVFGEQAMTRIAEGGGGPTKMAIENKNESTRRNIRFVVGGLGVALAIGATVWVAKNYMQPVLPTSDVPRLTQE